MSIEDYKEIILDYIKDNDKLSDRQVGIDLADNPVPYSARHIRRYVAVLKKEQVSDDAFEIDLQSRRANAEFKLLEGKYKRLLQRHEELNNAYDDALLIKEYRDYDSIQIEEHYDILNEAVPILQLSDWHVEERVDRGTTLGLNESNPDIIAKRVDKLCQNTLREFKVLRNNYTMKTLLINLGGDFINNYLHEHDVQMNYMSPIEALIFAETLLLKYLTTIAENGDYTKIIIICNRGNHPRLTKRMQTSNDYKMNLEAILYQSLASKLNDSIFSWVIPESEFTYVDVFGKKIRGFHGHQVKYGGGVGGLTIPLIKAIMRWDGTIKADFNLMSHFHSYSMPTANTSLNGSLIGFNSYAMTLGCKYEPPMQSLQLLDKRRGFTTRSPLFCD